jgi:hypothetical protein
MEQQQNTVYATLYRTLYGGALSSATKTAAELAWANVTVVAKDGSRYDTDCRSCRMSGSRSRVTVSALEGPHVVACGVLTHRFVGSSSRTYVEA